MKRTAKWIFIIVLIIGTYILYELQLGAIPFLLLSIYFFVIGYLELKQSKNSRDRT
ncbi:hypothetical protein J2S13_000569 [Oikeobacillus pervagus]|uniref:Uncharacterized protein n=1 Tax=Oikeobacillus pervagus TaxID=1325931 RepID=A0AAJ1WI95_9BACI|nr:hypothetical protein [Oikeobacillus pervagus]MDQ0214173.1 hypothetical protein [Oikeobacillus pervagus]